MGGNPKHAQKVLDGIALSGLSVNQYFVTKEPTIEVVEKGVRLAKAEACDLIVGCGGGSVIDTGKAIAALLTNGGRVLDYLKYSRSETSTLLPPKSLSLPSAPYIAIPTTAGTGAEVTRNAVLSLPEQRMKVSLRSDTMIPKMAIIDPELALSLPPPLTASTGLDALTQLIEPYVSNRANPMTDVFCGEGIQLVAKSLRKAYLHGDDIEARENMALASLYGGLALANSALGAVHGLASPIGGMFPAPHGAVCGRLLPLAMEFNARALGRGDLPYRKSARYRQVARWLTGEPQAEVEDGIEWVKSLVAEFNIPRLSAYGIASAHFPEIVLKAKGASSMKGNPVRLEEEELAEILAMAL